MMDEKLIQEVERVSGRHMETAQDFVWLKEQICRKGCSFVSLNTLKRLWGYLPSSYATTRRSTLDSLAQYVGYRDYDIFCNHQDYADKTSNNVLSRHLSTKLLARGLKLHITWLPDRDLVVEHMGAGRFVVCSVENSKLSVGDMFTCQLIIENEPLYLGNLVHNGQTPVAYVAGKQEGVRFEVMED